MNMNERMTMKTTKNVLVCEDDPVQLKILTTLIDQAGYRSVSARTPSEAVIAARRCGIDAVLTDVQLQDGNAFDLVGDLRRIGFDTPVLMASAYATDGMKERARAAGARFFFDKPFDLPKIKARVDEVLREVKLLDATLVIVEGHAQVRAGLEKTAAEAGFTVIAAEDGAKALEMLRSGDSAVDLLLMDLHAHGSSGAKLIRKAREIAPSLHVVMMSGDASREEIRAGYEAGAASLVRKPVPAARLQSFLKASLKAARAEKERADLRRERFERRAAEPMTRKVARWIKSYTRAPSHSRKGSKLASIVLTSAALLIGVGAAYGLQSAYETADRFEAMADRAMQAMQLAASQPGATPLKQEAAIGRLQSAEQLRLMREANDATRRYYEGHLQELRWQNHAKPAPELPVQIPAVPKK
jgi:DNA-binding response OmpR family regulator